MSLVHARTPVEASAMDDALREVDQHTDDGERAALVCTRLTHLLKDAERNTREDR